MGKSPNLLVTKGCLFFCRPPNESSPPQVQSTKAAFAAILADGRVVAWGSSTYGGEITKEQEKKIRPNPKSTVV